MRDSTGKGKPTGINKHVSTSLQPSDITETFAARLDQQMINVGYKGPSRIGTEAITMVLMEMLLDVLSGCFKNRSNIEIAAKMRQPSLWEFIALRRKMKQEIYAGSVRNWREQDGNGLSDALLATLRGSEESELADLVGEVRRNQLPVTNYGAL